MEAIYFGLGFFSALLVIVILIVGLQLSLRRLGDYDDKSRL